MAKRYEKFYFVTAPKKHSPSTWLLLQKELPNIVRLRMSVGSTTG